VKLSCTLVVAMFLLATSSSLSQNPATFTQVKSPGFGVPADIIAADMDNNGLTDVLLDQEEISLTEVDWDAGNGKFPSGYLYSSPASSPYNMPVVTGDFNNDGRPDFAIVIPLTNEIAVYLNNGYRSYAPPIVSKIPLPAKYVLGFEPENGVGGIAAADFNGDGKLALVLSAGDSSYSTFPPAAELYVLEGDGKGGFGSPHAILNGGGYRFVLGDFDADGKADIAVVQATPGDPRNDFSDYTLYVLYGRNDFSFEKTPVYASTAGGLFSIGSGDLNGDGITDLFSVDTGNNRLGVFYADTSRTFKSYFVSLPDGFNSPSENGFSWTPYLSMADFNGDGRMDLVEYNSTAARTYMLEFFLAGKNPGEFTVQKLPLLSGLGYATSPVVGLFDRDNKPDVALNQNSVTNDLLTDPSYILTELNRTAIGNWGNCAYPGRWEGLNVCAAGTSSGATATFSAAANSFGKLRKIELWVDGKKVSEQHHVWDSHGFFDFTSKFTPGNHVGTFYAADIDNRLQRYEFTFSTSANGACASPPSDGVRTCSPASGASVISPVQAIATAKITGTLARMEVWVDGVKKYTETNSLTLDVSLALAAGSHDFTFYAVNTAGTKWESVVHAIVK
jgi:hypothetical protein